MVPIAPRSLTTVGFRRDIKFFLAVLVGFLCVVIVILLLVLQTFAGRAEAEVRARWELIANEAEDRLAQIAPSDRGSIETVLIYVRTRFSIPAVEFRNGPSRVIRSGAVGVGLEPIERKVGAATLTLYFDGSEIRNHRRTFYGVALISLASTIIGTLLLLLYFPRITAPIEAMLSHAKQLDGDVEQPPDEAAYLIDTFRRSIETLQRQEKELKRLHELEKTRADDLQRVTATLTRSLSSGFLAIDATGAVLEINGAGREILGIPADTPPSEALGERPFTRVLRDSVAKSEALSRIEVEESAGGARREIGLTTVPLRNEDGRSLGTLALFTDLTPVRELEARVRDLQTLADVGEMAAGIAHEFRNSLSTILGYLKLARKQPLDDAVASKVANAEEEAVQLGAAVEALLHFARPMRLDLQELDLRELVSAVAERLQRATPAVPIAVADGDPVAIEGDRNLLARAVENVLRNAIDAVVANGIGTVHVQIAATPLPAVTIADEGVGLDPHDAPRYFLPFQSGRPGGFGLGLALARKIVLLHGGSIRLTGSPGVGATATIEIPAPTRP